MKQEQIELKAVRTLDDLAEVRQKIEELAAEHQAEVDKILTPALRRKIEALNAALDEKTADLKAEEARLADAVKADVIAVGRTVKGMYLSAVWSKGRVKWNDDKLKGYAAAHPEVLAFREEGEPSVSIRKA